MLRVAAPFYYRFPRLLLRQTPPGFYPRPLPSLCTTTRSLSWFYPHQCALYGGAYRQRTVHLMQEKFAFLNSIRVSLKFVRLFVRKLKLFFMFKCLKIIISENSRKSYVYKNIQHYIAIKHYAILI